MMETERGRKRQFVSADGAHPAKRVAKLLEHKEEVK